MAWSLPLVQLPPPRMIMTPMRTPPAAVATTMAPACHLLVPTANTGARAQRVASRATMHPRASCPVAAAQPQQRSRACMFANDPATISRLEDTLSLAQSLAEVSAHKKTKEDESKSEKAKAALSLAPQADTDLAKACTAVHHDFEADPRVPEGCAMTLTVKKLESLATMLGFAIKGDAKRKKALHFTLQASTRIPPYVPTVHAACLTMAAGGSGNAPGPPVNPPPA